jgi:hypothetical protein
MIIATACLDLAPKLATLSLTTSINIHLATTAPSPSHWPTGCDVAKITLVLLSAKLLI